MVSFGSQVDFSVPHLKIRGLNKFYDVQGQRLHALKDIHLEFPKDRLLGLLEKAVRVNPPYSAPSMDWSRLILAAS